MNTKARSPKRSTQTRTQKRKKKRRPQPSVQVQHLTDVCPRAGFDTSYPNIDVVVALMNAVGIPPVERQFVEGVLEHQPELKLPYFERLQRIQALQREFHRSSKYRERLLIYLRDTLRKSTVESSAFSTSLSNEDESNIIGSLTRLTYHAVRMISIVKAARDFLGHPINFPTMNTVSVAIKEKWYTLLRADTFYDSETIPKIFTLLQFCGHNKGVIDAGKMIKEYLDKATTVQMQLGGDGPVMPRVSAASSSPYKLKENLAAASSVDKENRSGTYLDISPGADFGLRMLINVPYLTETATDSFVEQPRQITDVISRWHAYLWSHPSAYQPRPEEGKEYSIQMLSGRECLEILKDEPQTLTAAWKVRTSLERRPWGTHIIPVSVMVPIDTSLQRREQYPITLRTNDGP
ncbi:hypothetical protein GMRT_10298 [Giardia muris]|uniref:Uncharacterized protein n=1 Tax=Giardia muris TaxID=5742 RepID=A0A4Z1T724_GIAMU|nr:hypothetical protein GMRT_10298 [Giardia muris]|eukprot:TNJ29873.1 hypothetical protein GMRT_10298 [Giardia muris]